MTDERKWQRKQEALIQLRRRRITYVILKSRPASTPVVLYFRPRPVSDFLWRCAGVRSGA